MHAIINADARWLLQSLVYGIFSLSKLKSINVSVHNSACHTKIFETAMTRLGNTTTSPAKSAL